MKTFGSMEAAVQYIKETLRLDQLQYQYGSYSFGQKWHIRLVAEHMAHHVELTQYLLYSHIYDVSPKIPKNNLDICKLAFSKLNQEDKTVPAFKLYNRIQRKLPVILEETIIDLEIELALVYCGAHPSISHKHQGVFDINEISHVHEHQYQEILSEINKSKSNL